MMYHHENNRKRCLIRNMTVNLKMCLVLIVFSIYLCVHFETFTFKKFSERDLKLYRDKTIEMFHHAYEGYLSNAFPFDELKPLSCHGIDTWGSFSLTLIDALDTLAVMKNNTEFIRVVNHLVATADFNININVSVFETNIRVVGGLLSAHLLSQKTGMQLEPGWPCSGPLLHLAEAVARRLLPAFYTKTGMPYGTVNLRYGVPPGETPVTCTAGVATFIIEFGTLSRLTGDPVFERVALRALNALWEHRSSVGLVGNHINVEDGKWTAMDAGIGGGVDSYYEYLVKGSILFQDAKLMEMFNEYKTVISKYMLRDDWHFWVSMGSGHVTMPVFQSLESFWPGLMSLTGEIEQASKTLYNYHQIWKQFGFIPEFYDIQHKYVKREGYPLRPELIESVMYLYQATKDPYFLEIGVDILESIQHSARTECGYATVKNVIDHRLEDRMESFFLAETTKYLYLLFDPDNFLHNSGSCGKLITSTVGDCVIGTGGYVFNTEAHPIDVSAVYCCSSERKNQDESFQSFQNEMNLHSILDINERNEGLSVFKGAKKSDTQCIDIMSVYERIPDDSNRDSPADILKHHPFLRPWEKEHVSSKLSKQFCDKECRDQNSVNTHLISDASDDKKSSHLEKWLDRKKNGEFAHVTVIQNVGANPNLNFEKSDSAIRINDGDKLTTSKNEAHEGSSPVPPSENVKFGTDISDDIINSASKLAKKSVGPKNKNIHFSYHFPSVAADGDLRVTENAAIPAYFNSFSEEQKSDESTSNVQSKIDDAAEPKVSLEENENGVSITVENVRISKKQTLTLSGAHPRRAPIVPTIPLISCFDVELSAISSARGSQKENRSHEILFCPAQKFLARLNLLGEIFNADL